MAEAGWNRRDFIGAAALLALAVGVPAGTAWLTDLDESDAPTDRQRALMREVSQAVLPDTGTPGAGRVGVGDFVILALAHGLDGTRSPMDAGQPGWNIAPYQRADRSLRHVAWLEQRLDRAAGGDWLRKPADAKHALLAALDAEAYAEGNDAHPWRKIKGLVLTGYYTSETGGSRELNYELVPGRFEPNVAVTPATRSYSSDWTAVDFG